MTGPVTHLAVAREGLAAGRLLLAGGFAKQAGREAYLAAFHAALALIMARTGREPKTHKGTHVEFARAAVDAGIEAAKATFLGRSYRLKTISDYETSSALTKDEAQTALDEAAHFVETISTLLEPPASPG